MAGKLIEIKGSTDVYQGYFCVSENAAPGIVLLQEWWGLNDHIKDVADRLCAEGFTVLAPDFYNGKVAAEPDEAGSLMMALNIDEAARILIASVETLLAREECRSEKVGVVGFCMGGQLSLFAACLDARIGACADFYGIHPNVKPELASLHAPLLGIFAEHDAYASPEAVAQLSQELTNLGKVHEFHTYPGTHHAFFNDSRPSVYNSEAAQDAWSKLVSFFKRSL